MIERPSRRDATRPAAARILRLVDRVLERLPVARAICFLLSDYAQAITGEIVHVDGGFHALGAPTEPSSAALT